MKKIIKVLVVFLIIIFAIYLLLLSINNNNDKYLNNITKDIKTKYKVKDKITYSNKYGNYYIFTTNKKVVVLNKEYEEIISEDITILAENKNDYALIYKNNKLMYINLLFL